MQQLDTNHVLHRSLDEKKIKAPRTRGRATIRYRSRPARNLWWNKNEKRSELEAVQQLGIGHVQLRSSALVVPNVEICHVPSMFKDALIVGGLLIVGKTKVLGYGALPAKVDSLDTQLRTLAT